MKKRFLGLLLASLFVFSGCSAQSPDKLTSSGDTVSAATRSRYRVNEIDQYQGTRLDPAIGPRDNSIKGIQQVDTASYTLSIEGLVNQPVELSYNQVRELVAYERLITLYCVEGWEAT
ncbi:MAG: molybdopterin-dependent oxidoreductase, partial [Eubacteriales bacterium]